jgi:purine-cytosine permease-like protein
MSLLERLMGPPMAAPETPRMRRQRIALMWLSSMLGVGVLLVGAIRALLGPVVTGAAFAVLLLSTIVFGAVYFIGKARRDDAWLEHLILDRSDR